MSDQHMTAAGPGWLPAFPHRPDHSCEEVEVTCPVRVSLGGGGTDLLSYAGRYGCSIVSLAIDRYVRLRMTRAERSSVVWSPGTENGAPADPLRLVARVLNVADPDCRYDVELASDQNFGSGLGTSSALVVSVLVALEAFHGATLTPAARAAEAFRTERVRLGEAGGFQDHLAPAFGGFRYYRFSSPASVAVEAIPGNPDHVVQALLLCDSGITRSSARVLAGQILRVAANHEETMRRLHRIRDLAGEVFRAVSAGDVPWLASCVDAAWRVKRELDPAVSSRELDSLIDAGRDAGALAARVIGAGGGGHLLFVVPPGRWDSVCRSLVDRGGMPFGVTVAPEGARASYRGPRRPPAR